MMMDLADQSRRSVWHLNFCDGRHFVWWRTQKGSQSMTTDRLGRRLFLGMTLASAIPFATMAQFSAHGREPVSIFDGVLGNIASSPEVSTSELQAALAESITIVLDARPYEEYAVSHIPGAQSVPGKPGTTPALYVADVAEILKRTPDKAQPLIVYCNGLFCGRSERFAEELTKAGYRNVRRYQLGAPAWRALGGVMQVEKSALLRILKEDMTAVLIDGRKEADRKRVRNAVSIPLPDASKAKDDGRLPMMDHNTRIFVVASNGAEARSVAEAIVHDAFHNVTFFDGPITDLPELLEDAGH
jgi:rhodanese-related sulfurtransferase